MFFNPLQFNKHSTENPSVEMTNLVRLPVRR
jgi:hypothetical protein